MKKIIQSIKKICEDEGLSPTSDMILQCATQLKIFEKSGVQKKPTSYNISNPGAQVTTGQKNKLDELGVKYPETLTMGEADFLIRETLSKTRQEAKKISNQTPKPDSKPKPEAKPDSKQKPEDKKEEVKNKEEVDYGPAADY